MLAAAFTSSKLINAEYSHTSKPRSLKFAYGLFHRLGHHYHLHRWSMWQKVIKSSITHIKSTGYMSDMSERNEQNKICLLLLGLLPPFYCKIIDFQINELFCDLDTVYNRSSFAKWNPHPIVTIKRRHKSTWPINLFIMYLLHFSHNILKHIFCSWIVRGLIHK